MIFSRVTLAIATVMAAGAHSAAAATVEATTAAAIARVHAIDPQVHAVIALDPTALAQARALDRAQGPRGSLFGVPVLIKDNIETAGPLPTTAGSMALLSNVSGRDAPLVAGLRTAGAVVLGKTNLSEWANIRSSASVSGWSAVGGQTHNPYALDRNPCGSSSGSAAAVASGMVDAAIGTETDGSITCPASVNGIVGLKPTVGLVSRTGVVPISHSQDTPGPMTRDVRMAARVLTAIARSDPADAATVTADSHRVDYVAALRPEALRGARIGVMRFVAAWPAPVEALFDAALARLKAQGAILVDIDDFKGREAIGPAETVVLSTELKADLNAYLAQTPPAVHTRTLADVIAFNRVTPRETVLFGQDLFEKAERTSGLTDPAYLAARATSLRLAGRDGIDAMLAAHKVVALVAPTMPPAWMIDPVNGDQGGVSGAADFAAVAGYPHLTVPMGAVGGLPVGLSFIGAAWSEETLLGFGFAFETSGPPHVAPRLLTSVDLEEKFRQAAQPISYPEEIR